MSFIERADAGVAGCGIAVHVDGERVTAIRGDERDPASHGYVCAKAKALTDLHEDPDRLRHPMRRTAHGWERIGWNDALSYAAGEIVAVQRADRDRRTEDPCDCARLLRRTKCRLLRPLGSEHGPVRHHE